MDRRSLLFLICIMLSFFLIQTWYEKPKIRPSSAQNELVTSGSPVATEQPPPPQPSAQQASYFVLENGYQQLVFSSVGGALVEINLPFVSPSFPKSVVLPVEADKALAQIPGFSRFPSVQAKNWKGEYVPEHLGDCYPLLRRAGLDNPGHAALALTSTYPELALLTYTVTNFTERSITFEARQPNRIIKKVFSFPKEEESFPYCFDLEVSVEGDRRNLWLTSGVPEVELMSGASGAALKYRIARGSGWGVEKLDLPNPVTHISSLAPDWLCNSNGFFGIILDPVKGNGTGMSFCRLAGDEAPSRLGRIGPLRAPELPGFEAKLPLSPAESPLLLRVFAGPFADKILSTIDASSVIGSAKPTNYLACQTFHGWFAFISEPFAKFLFFLMKFFYKVLGSWTLCIILATIVLRILLYPLNTWSMRSMRSMQEIAPLIKAIQERHRKDPTRAQLEIMALYKERRVNPFSGCLPLLIQMPFLMGMFDLLRSSFELRGAAFIPGWIDNLAAPDTLFSWDWPLPIVGNQFHLLPILLGATMWLQQQLASNLPKNPDQWTDQQRQQRAMGSIMTVMMTIMFYSVPSGLNIYWISSMILGIVQQWWTNRQGVHNRTSTTG